MGLDKYVEGSKWFYAPNKAAPIVFCVLFFITGAIHLFQVIRYKSWRTTLLMPWAAALMIAGFLIRELGAHDYTRLDYVIASGVLIFSGPPVYALTNYFILSRMLFYIPYLAPMHPGRVATTFVGLDAVIEILIAQGAWRSLNTSLKPKEREIGISLIKASLILQAVLYLSFSLLALQFQYRAQKAGVLSKKFRTILIVLQVSSWIVLARCIYRIVENFEGWTGQVFSNEVYFWIFEASIMFINSVLLNIWHPGPRLPRSNKVFLARDGVTERVGPGWDDDRPWIVTMFDPFDVWGMFTHKDENNMFWDMTDEQLEALRRQKKMDKRHWWSLVADPFHLWGPKGYIGRHITGNKTKNEPVLETNKPMPPSNGTNQGQTTNLV